ncbi:MAG: chemotaxis protein CheW [Ruminococcus sp.]|nr:chemotaxis protein CheW [Ruminococcus sp.]
MEAEKYLVFSVDGHIFSVNFTFVKQIVPATEPERIPDFPEYVLGTVKFENRYIPVIDLTRRFQYDLGGVRNRDCFIVTNNLEKQVALLVNDIYGFSEVMPEQIQPAVELNEQACARFLIGEFTDEQGRECRIIDPEKVIKLGDERIFDEQAEEE